MTQTEGEALAWRMIARHAQVVSREPAA